MLVRILLLCFGPMVLAVVCYVLGRASKAGP